MNVFSSDTTVNLLGSMKEYHRYYEIAVRQCANGGRDCKIHGLRILGRKRVEDEEYASVLTFLASDSEVVMRRVRNPEENNRKSQFVFQFK